MPKSSKSLAFQKVLNYYKVACLPSSLVELLWHLGISKERRTCEEGWYMLLSVLSTQLKKNVNSSALFHAWLDLNGQRTHIVLTESPEWT